VYPDARGRLSHEMPRAAVSGFFVVVLIA
jgi:hypothetical protein